MKSPLVENHCFRPTISWNIQSPSLFYKTQSLQGLLKPKANLPNYSQITTIPVSVAISPTRCEYLSLHTWSSSGHILPPRFPGYAEPELPTAVLSRRNVAISLWLQLEIIIWAASRTPHPIISLGLPWGSFSDQVFAHFSTQSPPSLPTTHVGGHFYPSVSTLYQLTHDSP